MCRVVLLLDVLTALLFVVVVRADGRRGRIGVARLEGGFVRLEFLPGERHRPNQVISETKEQGGRAFHGTFDAGLGSGTGHVATRALPVVLDLLDDESLDFDFAGRSGVRLARGYDDVCKGQVVHLAELRQLRLELGTMRREVLGHGLVSDGHQNAEKLGGPVPRLRGLDFEEADALGEFDHVRSHSDHDSRTLECQGQEVCMGGLRVETSHDGEAVDEFLERGVVVVCRDVGVEHFLLDHVQGDEGLAEQVIDEVQRVGGGHF